MICVYVEDVNVNTDAWIYCPTGNDEETPVASGAGLKSTGVSDLSVAFSGCDEELIFDCEQSAYLKFS